MDKTVSSMSTKEEFEENVTKLFTDYLETRYNSFNEQLTKIKTEE
jgi:hypothetical protein